MSREVDGGAATCLCVSLMDTSKCPVHGGPSKWGAEVHAAPDAARPAVTAADPRVVAVLAEHTLHDNGKRWVCVMSSDVHPQRVLLCRWSREYRKLNPDAAHRTHVATALAEAGIGLLAEGAAHGVALDKGSGIVCLCGEICNAVMRKSPDRLMGTTSDYYEAVNAGTVFAQHLRAAARAAAARVTTEGQ